jgi:hypothetical protein
MQALSPQNRMIGVIGAVEAGVALWYFTSVWGALTRFRAAAGPWPCRI